MVRVCEVTYDKAPLEKDGITVVVRAACCCAGSGRGGGWGPSLGSRHAWPLCVPPAAPPSPCSCPGLISKGLGCLRDASLSPCLAFGALSPGSGCLREGGLGAPGGPLGRLYRGRGEGPWGLSPWSPVLGTDV